MEQVVPQAFSDESPSEAERKVDRFNRTFGDALTKRLREQGMLELREIVVTSYDPKLEFGLGEALDLWRRIGDYQGWKTRDEAQAHYGRNITDAIDPRNGLVAPLFAGSAVNVMQLCQAAFEIGFSNRERPT